jgi:alkanesulfonate monooxygenase SsuD/methylene tetrahydromethanopterin reductase-like flavin-dependent oxidoreductase (luciferase family)
LPEENEAVGVVPYADRGRYADEFLSVLAALWHDDEAEFRGWFFSFGPVRAAPKPWTRRRLPIAVGGNRAAALRRVARFGDCWHGLGLSTDGVRKRLVQLDGYLEEQGRRRADLVVSLRYEVTAGASPGALIDLCESYRDAGVQEMALSLGSADTDAQQRVLDTIAAEVIPALR